MRAVAENYKGIEYIRISSLPSDQKKSIYQSLNQKLIINILKQDAILNDCLQYRHYIIWYENVFRSRVQEGTIEQQVPAPSLTLALSNFHQ